MQRPSDSSSPPSNVFSKYLFNRWEPMNPFFRRSGAMLDRNVCKQALKLTIRHRKYSRFEETQRGGDVGDICISARGTFDECCSAKIGIASKWQLMAQYRPRSDTRHR
jgi:hypothetical protein